MSLILYLPILSHLDETHIIFDKSIFGEPDMVKNTAFIPESDNCDLRIDNPPDKLLSLVENNIKKVNS